MFQLQQDWLLGEGVPLPQEEQLEASSYKCTPGVCALHHHGRDSLWRGCHNWYVSCEP